MLIIKTIHRYLVPGKYQVPGVLFAHSLMVGVRFTLFFRIATLDHSACKASVSSTKTNVIRTYYMPYGEQRNQRQQRTIAILPFSALLSDLLSE